MCKYNDYKLNFIKTNPSNGIFNVKMLQSFIVRSHFGLFCNLKYGMKLELIRENTKISHLCT